jgi:hypothetical protein
MPALPFRSSSRRQHGTWVNTVLERRDTEPVSGARCKAFKTALRDPQLAVDYHDLRPHVPCGRISTSPDVPWD